MREIILVVFLFVSNQLYAAPIKWVLNDVVFDDGGTASGSYKLARKL